MEWVRVLFVCYFLCVTVICASKTNQSEPSERIAGGVTATPNEFPWMVYLMLRNGGLTRATCAGTLINRQWILTDSYCVNPNFNQLDNIVVYLGAHDVSAQSEPYRVNYTSTTFLRHPTADIGLIKLPTSVTYTDQIKAVSFTPSNDVDHTGELVYLAGWGQNSSGPILINERLNKVSVPVISQGECESFYGTGNVKNDQVCTSGNSEKGICLGDIGGPMMYRHIDGNISQIAVATRYLGDCRSNLPSLFTRTRSYLDWIKSNAGEITINSAQSINKFQLAFTTVGIVVVFIVEICFF